MKKPVSRLPSVMLLLQCDRHPKRSVWFSPVLLAMVLSPALLQFTCVKTGDTTLSSLEFEVWGANQIAFDSSKRQYHVSLPVSADVATVHAVSTDPGSQVNYNLSDTLGFIEGGWIGIGGGQVSFGLPTGRSRINLSVTAPGKATGVYSLNISVGCSDCNDGNECTADTCDPFNGGACGNTNVPDGTVCDAGGVTGACSSGVCGQVDLSLCDAQPIIRTTDDGVEFVRTPSGCFEDLPGFAYELKHVDIDGLRQGYVDEGPANAPVVLLLHGQPTWAFLYRKMIPILVGAGYRVVAMDHLGTGYSDKPIDIADYSYLGHIDRLEQFINALGLSDITLFAQDWGSVIGLHVAGENPDWFARIVIGDGTLPVVPAGVELYPPVENPDEIDPDLQSPFQYPAQQVPFYNGCTLIGAPFDFAAWMEYAMKAEAFRAAEFVEAATWFDIPTEDEAAYDAPFPSRIYMAGIRVFPSLANEQGGVNQNAWASLQQFEKPFLTIWASNDPIDIVGSCATQDRLIDNIPGAAGLPHVRLPQASHFLQDDQGVEIANRIVALMLM